MASPKPILFRFDGVRVTIHSTNDFSTVMSKIYSSIGSPDSLKLPGIYKSMAQPKEIEQQKDAFVAGVNAAVGPHGFMLFQELDHGSWIQKFGFGGGLGLKRLVFGNPLIAKTMMEHDLTAGLFAPVEVLIMEKQGGTTDLVYNMPSCLVAGYLQGKNQPLLKAAEALDEKMAQLMEFVAA